MKNTLFILLISAFAVFPKVGIIVNKDLIIIPHVKSAVDTYISDLLATGEQVWVDSTTFDDGNTRPELQQLRDSLRTRFLYDDITGAVLIGNLPVASFERWEYNYNDSIWGDGENFPVDYYFMNIDDQLDTAWHDDSTELTNHGDSTYPYYSGYFDDFTGDDTVEIWVSRIIAHNFYHSCPDSVLDDTLIMEGPFSEDSVIADYLQRVHNRMTAADTTARRALLMGDFKNWFYEDQPHIENLNIPLTTFRFPHDDPDKWQRELRRGYEWASIFEHSYPEAHAFAQDHNEENGRFLSYIHRLVFS